jgi:PleD family two-component response regulator
MPMTPVHQHPEGPAMTLANPISHFELTDDNLDDDFDGFIEELEPAVEDSRILVVDDDARAATLMSRLLERDGFRRVVTACDGERALEFLFDRPPDVVVLDVHLPHIDGFEVLREILRHDLEVGRVTGIVAISGDATASTCQTMLWAGADDFISRPFASAEFAMRVRRIAHRTRALRQALGHARLLDGRLRGVSPQ